MIAALLIGREGSVGFPGKNLYPVLGRPLMLYPLLVARNAKHVSDTYVSTDSDKIKQLARDNGAHVIDRPAYLCSKEALGEDVFVHGYRHIKDSAKKDVELVVLLFCNAPTVTSELIDQGVDALRKDPGLDSAVSVSRYNMWSPLRARREGPDGLLHPFVPFEVFGDPKTLNCDRDSQGDVWFADMGVSIVRPRCLENLSAGLLPQKWMGQKIFPLKQWGGLDVDYEWQMPMVEFWLKAHGFSAERTPYDRHPETDSK
ncbi:MAG: cytidylyltransferase [Planctomycetota bacterium]|nr:cytidylyltransferase [Planctomycetota bacterium]